MGPAATADDDDDGVEDDTEAEADAEVDAEVDATDEAEDITVEEVALTATEDAEVVAAAVV